MPGCRLHSKSEDTVATNLRLVKPGETKEPSDYEKKIVKHKMGNLFKFLVGILIIAIAGVMITTQTRNKVYTTYNRVSSETLKIASGVKTLPFSDRLLLYSNDGIKCTDSKGKDVWNQAYEMQNPLVRICDKIVAVGDYNGRKIYVMSTSGTLGEIDTNMPITNFCVAGNGEVATILEESGISWIYLYDSAGELLAKMKTTMKNSGYPVAISLSPSGKLLQVSYLYADSGKIKASVAFYNFGEVGQDAIDNYVSGYDYADSIVPFVQFMSDSMAFAVADGRLMFYSGTQKPVSAAEVLFDKEVQAVYYNERYVALVYLNQSGETKYQMDVYNSDGNKKLTLAYDMDSQNILLDKETIVLYGKDECQVYSMDGVQKFAGNYEKMINLIIPTSSSYKYTVVTQDSIDVVQLK